MFAYERTEHKKATEFEKNFWNQENTETANGMAAYDSTRSALVDLFFKIGNARELDDELLNIARSAYRENREGYLSILLWARDCRAGAGRRNVPRVLLRKWFESGSLPDKVVYNIMCKLVELGRWDDLWAVALDTKYERTMANLIREALTLNDRLCAKWLPRKGVVAAKIRNLLGMTPKQYRKTIVSITQVVETHICKGQFERINYNHVPSQAMFKYTRLFNRKDFFRFTDYKDGLKKGTAK
jgi:hypothetical protein